MILATSRNLILVILASVIISVSAEAEGKGTEMNQTIRRPVVAGQFYTSDPAALHDEVSRYMSDASPGQPKGSILALISPHAGYIYSGHVAGWGFSLLRGSRFDAVVVISPSHVEYFPWASIYHGEAYETPLGRIPVDRELSRVIAEKSDLIKLDGRGHETAVGGRGEHALEVQLPFLQVALGEFKLIPIVMGDQSTHVVEALGAALGELHGEREILIVASTDLSHFHDDSTARRLDGEFIDNIEKFDIEGLLKDLGSGSTEACGGGPAAAAMIASKYAGEVDCRMLKYANSGEISGDRRNVVGYVSAVISQTGDDGDEIKLETRAYLLGLARSVIERNVGLDPEDLVAPPSPVLEKKRGGFVTLKTKGRLRGCIGYIEAVKPLEETIADMAYSAAFRDGRFNPVTADEIDDIRIEISVLSPIKEIEDPSSIIVGKHGIIITRGGSRGLLLPQVAEEWGWDRDTFLDQTCLKAGLPPGSWRKEGTKIEIFSAEIFSEEDLGLR
jgi:AmmeMemoRadiSam system protein B/AmmeMemoRadiSam system protein A